MSLNWPDEYERTPPDEREPYPYNFRVSQSDAFKNIITQVERMEGATSLRIETAAEHKSSEPNIPESNASPREPGVVVRFDRDGVVILPCDRWLSLRDNAQAIAKYIEAKRALDRYGVGTLESEFDIQKVRVD